MVSFCATTLNKAGECLTGAGNGGSSGKLLIHFELIQLGTIQSEAGDGSILAYVTDYSNPGSIVGSTQSVSLSHSDGSVEVINDSLIGKQITLKCWPDQVKQVQKDIDNVNEDARHGRWFASFVRCIGRELTCISEWFCLSDEVVYAFLHENDLLAEYQLVKKGPFRGSGPTGTCLSTSASSSPQLDYLKKLKTLQLVEDSTLNDKVFMVHVRINKITRFFNHYIYQLKDSQKLRLKEIQIEVEDVHGDSLVVTFSDANLLNFLGIAIDDSLTSAIELNEQIKKTVEGMHFRLRSFSTSTSTSTSNYIYMTLSPVKVCDGLSKWFYNWSSKTCNSI